MCDVRRKSAVSGMSNLQYEKRKWCSTRRVISAVRGGGCAVRRECTALEGLHLQHKDRVCAMMRKSAVSGMSHLQYEQRKCAVPGGSNLQYEEKVVHCEERVYRIRKATSAVGGQDVWCEEKVCIIRTVTSAVQGEKVYGIWRVVSAVQAESCIV